LFVADRCVVNLVIQFSKNVSCGTFGELMTWQ
jgi:hypothetical protein